MQVARLINQETGESRLVLFNWEIKKGIPYTDTYGRYGQRITHEEASSFISPITPNQEFLDRLNILAEENGLEKETEVRETYGTYWPLFDLILESPGFVEGVDYELYQETCDALTYWDGSNFCSVVFAYESDPTEPDAELVEDELSEEILAAYDRAEFKECGFFGESTYEDQESGYRFEGNCMSHIWYSYDVVRINQDND